jgi:hypothetical protein
LPRRFAPRNDAWARRERALFDIQLSNSPMCIRFIRSPHERSDMRGVTCVPHPGCRYAHPGYGRPDMRHRPSCRPARAAGRFFSCRLPQTLKEGVRNDRAFHRARGARMVWMRAARMPLARHTGGGPASAAKIAKSRTGPRKQIVACVPHANGLCGLLHVPRNCRFCRHVPGSCGLPPGHALGPSARRAGVNRLLLRGSRTFHP